MHAPPFIPQSIRTPIKSSSGAVNVGEDERLMSLGAGLTLLVTNVFSSSHWRPLSLLASAGLIYRGMTGHCHAYDALGIDTAEAQQKKSPSTCSK